MMWLHFLFRVHVSCMILRQLAFHLALCCTWLVHLGLVVVIYDFLVSHKE